MEGLDILTLIGNYAFPIVMCLALFWKMDKDQKANADANAKRDQLHREEMESLRQALENNTAAIAQLNLTIQTNK